MTERQRRANKNGRSHVDDDGSADSNSNNSHSSADEDGTQNFPHNATYHVGGYAPDFATINFSSASKIALALQ
jgi:hypothetical protein